MKNNLPIEKQVCILEQSQKLAEILGVDAPGSLWVWIYSSVFKRWELKFREKIAISRHDKKYPAYTGDELGVLLLNSLSPGFSRLPPLAGRRAALAIQGLAEGWIKKEEFVFVPDPNHEWEVKNIAKETR